MGNIESFFNENFFKKIPKSNNVKPSPLESSFMGVPESSYDHYNFDNEIIGTSPFTYKPTTTATTPRTSSTTTTSPITPSTLKFTHVINFLKVHLCLLLTEWLLLIDGCCD